MKSVRYELPQLETRHIPNLWDVVVFVIIFAVLAALAWGASHMIAPYNLGQPIEISLDPRMLPEYSIRTILRMLIALFFSFLFTFIVAPIAAKNRQAEKILIPLIDILQSVPILGMLSITIVGFIYLFPGSLLGPECAAIFAIFTSQVWNMTLSLYQSLRMMPRELNDTALIFHLSAWQQFWRIELPRAMPSLLWNTMISLSGGWFFVVAAEAISVSNQSILLPGIGSYISVAIANADLNAVFYAIFAMFLVILLYDQLLFRPLLTWAEKFKTESGEEDSLYQSWFYGFLAKTRVTSFYTELFNRFAVVFINPSTLLPRNILPKKLISFPFKTKLKAKHNNPLIQKILISLDKIPWQTIAIITWNILLIAGVIFAAYFLLSFISQTVSISEIQYVFYLGAITGIKVAILVILVSIVWIPIGVWIGLRPKFSRILQPIVQFVAAFPANLIYPIVVTLIVRYSLDVNIWSSPLMVLGTQWYILFNVIAASSAIPSELKLVCKNFFLPTWLQWKRLILPAIFPYTVTGAMATAAGAWNASIVADVLDWGDHHLVSLGLGSYIAEHTATGDFPRIALSVFVMCCYVLLINRLIWQTMYQHAAKRYVLE